MGMMKKSNGNGGKSKGKSAPLPAVTSGTVCAIAAAATATCMSTCPSGYYATGPAFMQTAGAAGLAIMDSYPMTPTTWFVEVDAVADDWAGNMYAVCVLL